MAAGVVELSLAWQNNEGATAVVIGGEGGALREVVCRREKKMVHRCSSDSPNETRRGGSAFGKDRGEWSGDLCFGQRTRRGSCGGLRRVARCVLHALQVEEGAWQVGPSAKT
jgi:hypothetical protein